MRTLTPRDGTRHWSWALPTPWGLGPDARSNHLALWREGLQRCALRLGLQQTSLGTVLGEPLWLWTRAAAPAPSRHHLPTPQRLVACGFHGEEPAGPWGLLQFLQRVDTAALDTVHLTLLPLVNCTGFAAGTRFNAEGDNPNRGFCRPHNGAELTPSAEGRLLLQHAALLTSASRDGALSCHEDVLADKAYIYALERSSTPSAQVRRLLQANLRQFAQQPDGLVDGCRVQDGVVFNHHDGSFEDWLFGLGAAITVCVETPALQPFEARVAAQADMIEAFVLAPADA